MKLNPSKVDYQISFYDGIVSTKNESETEFNHLVATEKVIRNLNTSKIIKCKKNTGIDYLKKEEKTGCLHDSYTDKILRLDKTKISNAYFTRFLTNENINDIISNSYSHLSLSQEAVLLFREYIRRNSDKLIGNNRDDFIPKLKKDKDNYEKFLSFLEKDGIWNYYNIFLNADVLMSFLTTCSKTYVKYIYNVCIFSYNSLMCDEEKKIWEKLINDKKIENLFYYAGGIYSNRNDKDYNYLTSLDENEIINELLKHKMYDLTCYSDAYDITESEYIKYILKNENFLYQLFQYDASQYSIILKKIDDLKYSLDNEIIEEFKTNTDYFKCVIKSSNLYQNDKLYKYQKGAKIYGSKENILKTAKKYAKEVYNRYSEQTTFDSMIIFNNIKEIAVKLKNIQGVKIDNSLIKASRFYPKNLSNTSHDDEYIFLTNLGDGIFKEVTTGIDLILSNKLNEYQVNQKSKDILKNYPLCIISDSSIVLSNEEEYAYLKNKTFTSGYIIREVLSHKYDESIKYINNINPNPIENNIIGIISGQMHKNSYEDEEKQSEETKEEKPISQFVDRGYYVRKK